MFRGVYWLAVAAIWAIIAVVALLGFYALDLPDVDRLGSEAPKTRIVVVAADGSEIATFGGTRGDWVTTDDVPVALVHAVLATEDRRFYSHMGIDILGLMRAAAANIRAGSVVQGGSTITQQLAKNLFLTPERTLKRKIREVLLALWLEHTFSKDQILALYLNRVYLGAGTHGVDGAARRYFGKPVRALNVRQSALIAGLLKAPSRYAPTNSVEGAAARTAQVVLNMVDAGYLSAAAAERVGRQPFGLSTGPASGHGRYFADWVVSRLSGFIGTGHRDIVVHTTLDGKLQRSAEKAVARAMNRDGERLRAGQAALVAFTPDGAVRAMVGGRSYAESQFNRVTQAVRQPGSAFKLFVYLAAMETGLTPDSVMRDAPLILDGWRPRNYSGDHAGPVTLRVALVKSINTVAVKLSERVDRRRVAAMAHRLGISTPITQHPSVALGTSEVRLIELTSAYGALASGGMLVVPYAITRIETGDGEVLHRRRQEAPPRVILGPQVGQLSGMLREVLNSGTGKSARLSRPAAGKTGTSQDFRDAVFVGYTAQLIAGVWVGNDDATPMRRVTGGGLPAVIWRDFMEAATADHAVRPLPGPEAGKKPGFWERLFSRD